jgi:hypothetical protein
MGFSRLLGDLVPTEADRTLEGNCRECWWRGEIGDKFTPVEFVTGSSVPEEERAPIPMRLKASSLFTSVGARTVNRSNF